MQAIWVENLLDAIPRIIRFSLNRSLILLYTLQHGRISVCEASTAKEKFILDLLILMYVYMISYCLRSFIYAYHPLL